MAICLPQPYCTLIVALLSSISYRCILPPFGAWPSWPSSGALDPSCHTCGDSSSAWPTASRGQTNAMFHGKTHLLAAKKKFRKKVARTVDFSESATRNGRDNARGHLEAAFEPVRSPVSSPLIQTGTICSWRRRLHRTVGCQMNVLDSELRHWGAPQRRLRDHRPDCDADCCCSNSAPFANMRGEGLLVARTYQLKKSRRNRDRLLGAGPEDQN